MLANELLKQGNLAGALKELENQVRKEPAAGKHRIFLFQLLSLLGQWERALTQASVASDLDPTCVLMTQVGQKAIACELFRKEVFAGTRLPLVLGEPQEWLGWLIQANQMTARGQHEEGQALRQKAFEAAPTTGGTMDGTRFEWIADADQRLGPVVEVIMDGKYYWCPFTNIREIAIDKPVDLRDLVWAPAKFTWVNGGQAVGLIPARYPGSEGSPDNQVVLARTTQWVDGVGGLTTCLGQRLWATDVSEMPILETRSILLDQVISAEAFAETEQA